MPEWPRREQPRNIHNNENLFAHIFLLEYSQKYINKHTHTQMSIKKQIHASQEDFESMIIKKAFTDFPVLDIFEKKT
jgi:hypothetical protein